LKGIDKKEKTRDTLEIKGSVRFWVIKIGFGRNFSGAIKETRGLAKKKGKQKGEGSIHLYQGVGREGRKKGNP